jgi:hypothetical protein
MADQLVLAVRVGGGRAEVVVTRVTYLLITIYSSRITTVYDFGRGGTQLRFGEKGGGQLATCLCHKQLEDVNCAACPQEGKDPHEI